MQEGSLPFNGFQISDALVYMPSRYQFGTVGPIIVTLDVSMHSL